MEYFEVEKPSGEGYCSDNACPCADRMIPQGTGYLFIPDWVVEYRKNAKTINELKVKLERDGKLGNMFFAPVAILVCSEGAKLRGLDLKVAAKDAQYWWKTGKAPLRPTPIKVSK